MQLLLHTGGSGRKNGRGQLSLNGQSTCRSCRFNNTFVFDGSSPCNVPQKSKTPIQCSGTHGGFFDEGSSTSWDQVNDLPASGAAIEEMDQLVNDAWGTDSLKLNSTLLLENFPLGITRANTEGFNMIGLGRNSTLLNALFSVGAIASRTWGFAWGWQGADSNHQRDGSLILGGYDFARTKGPNVTYPFALTGGCRLVVTVTNIVLNLKNGSSVNLLPQSLGTAMRACLCPDYPLMSLSEDIFNNFITATEYAGAYPDRSVGINFWGMVFQSKDAYDGDMTFTLSPGFDIRIPNHQLVIPDYSVNTQGFLTSANTSSREVLINSLQEINKNDWPMLGRSFLSSTYLFVDHDHEQFVLWNANPTATEQNLIPVGPATCRPSPTGPTPSSASGLPSSLATARNSSKGAISKGGIAGLTVGILAACLLAFLLFLLFRHRYRHRQSTAQQPERSSKTDKDDLRVSSYLAFKPEMPTDKQPPQEMPSVRDPGYAVAPYEIPAGPGTSFLEQGRWERGQHSVEL
ncbi:MAG: hypothetical protein Q9213_000127 [Squamulea squamosa]